MAKKQKSDAQLRYEHTRKVLEIYEGERKLSKPQIAKIISQLSDKDIELLARGDASELAGAGIKGNCAFTGWYVGASCLASKYGKYGVTQKPQCRACRADEIVIHLNYIFNINYEGKYCAKWRTKRKIVK
jgi:hypothetical protein